MHVLPTIKEIAKYDYFYMEVGIFLLCILLLAIIVYLFMDHYRVYKLQEIDDPGEAIINIILRHLGYSFILFAIVNIILTIVATLIIQ